MERGAWVQVRAFGGEILARRVVEVDGDTIAICRDEEYQTAQREGREPITVGFPRSAIVEGEEQKRREDRVLAGNELA
jgi:hypothetical protein